MNYVEFEVGAKAYKLRLNTRNLVILEKTIGCNPLQIFGVSGDTVPSITAMVAVLHASLQQYHHGITMNDAYDIFDNYLEDHSTVDFLPVILEVYKASGIIPKDTDGKNA